VGEVRRDCRAARRIVAKGRLVDDPHLAAVVLAVAEERLAVGEVIGSDGFVLTLFLVSVPFFWAGIAASPWLLIPAVAVLGLSGVFFAVPSIDVRQRSNAERAAEGARAVLSR
jgi:Ca2+/Na+ antiporter